MSWIAVLVVVLLNGQSEILYHEATTLESCEKQRLQFGRNALLEIKAGAPIRSVNSACVPADGKAERKQQ